MCIRDYYLNPDKHTPLCYMLHCKQKNRTWLNSFGEGKEGWERFIEDNYLTMYVDGEKYEVEPLFLGHNYENILPKNKGQIEEFLDKVCAKIEERGNQIIIELQDIIKKEDNR